MRNITLNTDHGKVQYGLSLENGAGKIFHQHTDPYDSCVCVISPKSPKRGCWKGGKLG